MARRLTVLGAVAVVLAACGSSSKGATYDVQIDGKAPSFNGGFNAYFPNEVKAHPGDTVRFKSIYRGEPHTVTLGSLVDAGLPKALAAGPDAPDEPAELKKIPDLLPQGPGDANQASAQPCYLASGDPPGGGAACPKSQQRQPDFDGTQSYYNSGFLPDQATFSVKLSKKIKPGTYNYFCALHRVEMSGKITVVRSGQAVPSATKDTQGGQSQLNDLIQKLQPTATAVKGGTLPPFVTQPKPGSVLAGGATMDAQNAEVNEFGPATASIPVGGSVTWTIVGPHTISFNPTPAAAAGLLTKAPDGSFHANQEAGAPAGGPGQPPPPEGPPPSTEPNAPPPRPTVVNGGRWEGSGFRSSGFFLSFPPQLYAYRLTFTRPGTYAYVCLVHPEMTGTIKVG